MGYWKVTDSCTALESVYLWTYQNSLPPTAAKIQDFICVLYLQTVETAATVFLSAMGGTKVDELLLIVAYD